MIIFLANDTNEKVIYENGISLLAKDTPLNDRLFPDNLNEENIPFSYKRSESEEAKNLFDVIMIKINVKNVGSFYSNFSKDELDNTKRKELMKDIKELASINSDSTEGRKEKVTKLIEIISNYSPMFMSVEITDNKEEVLSFLNELDFNYPVLVKKFIKLIDIELKDNDDFLIASEDDEDVVSTPRVRKNSKIRKTGGNSFANWLANNIIIQDFKVNYICYIFALVYPLFISAVTVLVFSFFNKNSVAYAIIMLVFIVVFMVIMFANNNSFFKGRDLIKTFKENYPLDIAYFVSSLLGIGLGVLIAYLVNANLLTSAEDPEFSYTAPILVAVLGTIAITVILYFISTIFLRKKKSK